MTDPQNASAPNASALAGRRLLVVEDEMLVAMLVEDLLTRLGAIIVGPAASVARALALARNEALDGAVLDVNLGGETAYPIADALQLAGVPFVFVTGYDAGSVIGAHRTRPTIQKPFNPENFAKDLARGLGLG